MAITINFYNSLQSGFVLTTSSKYFSNNIVLVVILFHFHSANDSKIPLYRAQNYSQLCYFHLFKYAVTASLSCPTGLGCHGG